MLLCSPVSLTKAPPARHVQASLARRGRSTNLQLEAAVLVRAEVLAYDLPPRPLQVKALQHTVGAEPCPEAAGCGETGEPEGEQGMVGATELVAGKEGA